MLVGEALFTKHPPFLQAIMEEPIPYYFKALSMEAYDGTTNPCNYLESFKVFMMLQEAYNTLMVSPFQPPSKIQPEHTRLPLDSNSFEKFGQKFIT